MTMAKMFAIAAFAVVLLTTSLGFATEYYLDPAGSDANSGMSEAEAWATLAALSGVEAGDTVNFKAGGRWETNGGITVNDATYKAYGTGPKPRIDGKNITFATIVLNDDAVLDGFFVTADTLFAVYLYGNNSIVRNCEIDGSGTGLQIALGVMGEGNLVTQNYVHDVAASTGDTGNVNSSGGAECYIVFGGKDIELSYNKGVRCACENQTLGGDEGGCFEILNPYGGTTVENVRIHHNYCEDSVGLFEAVTGSGTGEENPADNPGTIKNITLSYNLAVDSKWLYLLQILNTHLVNVVFEHNAIIHTARNEQIWSDDAMSHQNMLGMFFNYDPGTGSYVSDVVTPAELILRNNIFVEPYNTSSVWMGSGFGHTNNIFVPSTINLGTAYQLDATEFKIDDLRLTSDFRLAAGSPAIDKATSDTTYTVDIDGHPVPCGSKPDIGPSEYCEGSTVAERLTVTKSGTGSGRITSSPDGIDCGSVCSASFASGTQVTLTATAASGSTFDDWGGACSGTGTCTVTMNAGQEVIGTFNTSDGGTGSCTCPAGCASATSISVPFAKDGVGEFCWVATSLGSYINSWNLDRLDINGTDLTNEYASSSSLPAKVNGNYYVYYKGSYSWSHFEAK